MSAEQLTESQHDASYTSHRPYVAFSRSSTLAETSGIGHKLLSVQGRVRRGQCQRCALVRFCKKIVRCSLAAKIQCRLCHPLAPQLEAAFRSYAAPPLRSTGRVGERSVSRAACPAPCAAGDLARIFYSALRHQVRRTFGGSSAYLLVAGSSCTVFTQTRTSPTTPRRAR